MKRVLRSLLVLLSVALCAALVVLAGWFWRQANCDRPAVGEYVALGSSFASGPGIGRQAPDSPVLCYRSLQDYPHLLASKRHLTLVDRTCSGATSEHITHKGQYPFMAAQIEALTPATRLVTVTIGGNDVDYIRNLIAWSCQNQPQDMPTLWRMAACKPVSDTEVDDKLRALPAALHSVARRIRDKAPQATLVFVDYVTVLPDLGDCPDRLPLSQAQLSRGRHVASLMSDITANAAADADAILIRASDRTRMNDICSSHPWVFGWTLPSDPLRSFGAVAYHPKAEAMKAIAEAIDSQLIRTANTRQDNTPGAVSTLPSSGNGSINTLNGDSGAMR